jgi:nicotinamide mononucleotide transporter
LIILNAINIIILNNFFETLIANLKDTSLLEFIAVIFGIISVWLAKQENIWLYPTGIINTILFVYLYVIKTGLYADGIVNAYYTYMSVMGWLMWSKPNKQNLLKISTCNNKELLKISLFTLLTLSVLYTLLTFIMPKYLANNFTPSTVPFIDSLNAALSFTAMWLMNKKKIEHWLFWIIVNIISIPLNISKGLAFTGVQYLIFLTIAILGFISWYKKLKQHV